MRAAVEVISLWAVPAILLLIPLVGIARRVNVYEAFVDGAKEGFDVAIRILPFLVAILVAIGMFRASGAMALLTSRIGPYLTPLGFSPELLPLFVVRSLSGSGSLGLMTDIVKSSGADSLLGRTAATMYGSTETTFYVLAVYFGAIGIKRTRHAVPAALLGDVAALITAIVVCRWLFA